MYKIISEKMYLISNVYYKSKVFSQVQCKKRKFILRKIIYFVNDCKVKNYKNLIISGELSIDH